MTKIKEGFELGVDPELIKPPKEKHPWLNKLIEKLAKLVGL